jgi:hypothetical protein
MAEIIEFRRPEAKRQKQECKGHLLIDHPADRTKLLGQVDLYGTHVVVRPAPSCGARKRYELDTPLEGVRLLLRLHGLHQATVTPVPNGVKIHLPSMHAGDAQ